MLEWKELLYSFQHLFSDNIFWRFDWLEKLRQWLDFAPYALKRQSRDRTRVDRAAFISRSRQGGGQAADAALNISLSMRTACKI